MKLITKAISALEALTELPCALHACAEMAREAEANRASIRASEAFGSVCPGGPALLEAHQTLDAVRGYLREANDRLTRWNLWASLQFAVGASETDDATREKISSEIDNLLKRERDKLATVETELAREKEARRWRKQSLEPCKLDGERKIISRDAASQGSSTSGECVSKVRGLLTQDEWRYLSPEDMS